MNVLCVLVLLAADAKAVGAAPSAMITGPREAIAGDLVILDASQSSGLGFMWLLTNSKKSFYQADKGLRCLFSSRESGTYIFVLVVSGTTNNGGPDASMASHTLELVEPPGPAPPAPVPVTVPEGEFGLTRLAFVEGSQLPPDAKPILAKIADNFDAESAAIAAGARKEIADSQEVLKKANQASIPAAKRQVFLQFFQKWQESVTAHNQAGKLTTLEEYGRAYAETAAGMRSVK